MLDELRWLVPLPSLPAIASRDRSAGIGLVYAIQAMRQEIELYGSSTSTLESGAVQVSIVGGYDKEAAQTITHQAGEGRVATVSVGGSLFGRPSYTDGEQFRVALTIADQQKLSDGESVLRVPGLPIGLMFTPSFRQNRKLARAIADEERQVRERTSSARVLAGDQRRREFERNAPTWQYRDTPSPVTEHGSGERW